MERLKKHKLVYLGTPYTKYEGGIHLAFVAASAIAGGLLRLGVSVYSPIAHTHPLAMYANIDPLDHKIWLPFDQAMMDASDAMCIAKLEGWDTSYGIKHEIEVFRLARKPIYELDPATLKIIVHEPMELAA
jgi:hypothetical protein